MPTIKFPFELDDDTTLPNDYIPAPEADYNLLADAVRALEAKVGINGSPVTTSLDNKVGALEDGVIRAPEDATALGNVVGRYEVFDSAGASLGFIPIFDSIP